MRGGSRAAKCEWHDLCRVIEGSRNPLLDEAPITRAGLASPPRMQDVPHAASHEGSCYVLDQLTTLSSDQPGLVARQPADGRNRPRPGRWLDRPPPRALIPVLEQVTDPVPAVRVAIWEAGTRPVLGNGLAVLADHGGEPAEGDPIIRIGPECSQIDPLGRSEMCLRSQPGIECGLVEEQLPPAPAAPTA